MVVLVPAKHKSASLLPQHLTTAAKPGISNQQKSCGRRQGIDQVRPDHLPSLMRSAELAPGKLRKRNSEAFPDKAQSLRQQNGRCLKSPSAQPLCGTVCAVLKSLPVLSVGGDNIDCFLLNLSTPSFTLYFYC